MIQNIPWKLQYCNIVTKHNDTPWHGVLDYAELQGRK